MKKMPNLFCGIFDVGEKGDSTEFEVNVTIL